MCSKHGTDKSTILYAIAKRRIDFDKELGEDELRQLLSEFFCDKNTDKEWNNVVAEQGWWKDEKGSYQKPVFQK